MWFNHWFLWRYQRTQNLVIVFTTHTHHHKSMCSKNCLWNSIMTFKKNGNKCCILKLYFNIKCNIKLFLPLNIYICLCTTLRKLTNIKYLCYKYTHVSQTNIEKEAGNICINLYTVLERWSALSCSSFCHISLCNDLRNHLKFISRTK